MHNRSRILPILLALSLPACGYGGNAPGEATTFLATIYPGQTFNVDCQSWDSDGDGYVSCTAAPRASAQVGQVGADGRVTPLGEPVALECSRKLSMNSGCRLQRARIQR